jgi:hypothetical protein
VVLPDLIAKAPSSAAAGTRALPQSVAKRRLINKTAASGRYLRRLVIEYAR